MTLPSASFPKPARSSQFPTRRAFLGGLATAALAGPWWTGCAARRSRSVAPNAKLQHACIGVGGMGWVDLQNFRQHPRVQIVALCDVDAQFLERAARELPGARLYTDWRELLDKEADALDSVNVSVPDHMHFAIAYAAILRGKHVYCQKPLCHDVAEVRRLTEATRRKRVVTQLGTQLASNKSERQAVQLLRQGVIGKIRHGYLSANRPGALEQYRLPGPRPSTGQAPPPHLNWDLWLGTAPMRPYVPEIYHPIKWRAWQDFGTGWSGDIGCHLFDAVWKGLRLSPARTVVAEVQESWKQSPARRADNWPQSNHITWTFPANEHIAGPELVVEWFDGEFYPPADIRQLYDPDLTQYPAEAALLVGTEGALLLPLGYPPVLLPEDKFQGIRLADVPPRNHYHHFVDACLGGEMCESHFEQVGPMTEAVLLGTVAVRVPDQKLVWNHARLKFENHADADRLLRRRYRDGWHVAEF